MSENTGSSVVRRAVYLRSACDDVGSLAAQEALCRAAMRVQKATLLNSHAEGACYGYECATSKAITGTRLEVVESEAAAVRRIYQLYSDGLSARKIAHLLNEEGVAAPAESRYPVTSLWNRRSVLGILREQTYRGTVVWNCTRQVLDPQTGRSVLRRNPEAPVIRQAAPHLQIVDHQLARSVDRRLKTASRRHADRK